MHERIRATAQVHSERTVCLMERQVYGIRNVMVVNVDTVEAMHASFGHFEKFVTEGSVWVLVTCSS